MPTARFDLAAAAPGNGKFYAVGGHTSSETVVGTNEEYEVFGIVLAPVKAGDVVYSVGVPLKVGTQNIPANIPTTVSADGNLILEKENLVYAWVQRP
jgi:hypothetical protein